MVVLDGHVIDASLTESHKFGSEVTDYPVESGAVIADNVRLRPIEVTIEGIVSNTPLAQIRKIREAAGEFQSQATSNITATASPPFTSITNDVTPASTALAKLMRIRDQRNPVSITTALRVYDSMVMEDLEIPMSAEKSGGLYFTAKFKQVVIVNVERVSTTASASKGRGNGNVTRRGPETPTWVISFPTLERSKHTNMQRVLTDQTPPPTRIVNTVMFNNNWDHFKVDPTSSKVDGFVSDRIIMNPVTHAFITTTVYYPTTSFAFYDHSKYGWQTVDGKLIPRFVYGPTPSATTPVVSTPAAAKKAAPDSYRSFTSGIGSSHGPNETINRI